SAVLARSLPSITTLAANETETRSLEDKGPTVSAVWAVEVPPSGSLELRVEPRKEADLWGEVAVVSAEAWKSAEGSDAVLAELEPQWSEPLAPSDGDAMALTWGSPKEPKEDAQEASEPRVLLVSLWGAGAWKATAQISHQSPSGAGATP
ncbi:MAG TPA: hypothetical protein DIU15_04780, partial [Deltaproteobacteria bacterium]|nr:hypothetical protein [Deltaproteobacteria bacterium]